MKKTLLLLLLLPFFFRQTANAQQKTHEDSTEVINAARRYAAGFRLRNRDLTKFRQEHFLPTSDYFKPDSRSIAKALITDSLFVQTYRATAYDRTLDQQGFPGFKALLPPNHLRPGEDQAVYASPSELAAQSDAKSFTFSKEMLMRFKSAHFPETSDYFKPSAATASNSAMLNDSAYVRTFRFEAYHRVYHQREHPTGHNILIGGIVATGMAIVVLISVALSRVPIR